MFCVGFGGVGTLIAGVILDGGAYGSWLVIPLIFGGVVICSVFYWHGEICDILVK
jgi:hypothetical protein